MELSELRKQIDRIDSDLIRIFAERMEVAAQIAAYKREQGMAVLDESRERQKLTAVAEAAPDGMGDYTRMLFADLMGLSRAYQTHILAGEDTEITGQIKKAMAETPAVFPAVKGRPVRVACQGLWGAYSQHAADKLFGQPSIVFVNTFDAVFSAVEQGLCDYGIVPAENNNAGSVKQVWDLMTEHKFSIVRSVRVKIDHSLLTLPGVKKSEIKEIVSHEQALNQCKDYLHQQFPDAKIVPCKNTAIAAKMVSESGRHDLAAIASPDCAEAYSLQRLENSIQGSDNNRTRFFCISKNLEIFPGADRTALELELPHKPGSLYHVLSRFYVHNINLLK
ncbi:MAG: chorismate mutase, partial [Clostridia bacterium]|nr:chorismate mutase [Clostridia bacterium]